MNASKTAIDNWIANGMPWVVIIVTASILVGGILFHESGGDERKEEEVEDRRKNTERDAVRARYKNNEWRTQAEGYFFKGIKYGKGDGVFLNFEKSAQNFHIARNLAGPNEIAEMEKMIKHFSGEFLHKIWSASEYWDGYR